MRTHVAGCEQGHIAHLSTIEGGYSKQTSLFDWVNADGSTDSHVLRRDARIPRVRLNCPPKEDRRC